MFDDYFMDVLPLFVVTSIILIVVNAHESTYNANTSHLEYVKYLNCTLKVLIPNNIDSAVIDNKDTNLAANSEPSG